MSQQTRYPCALTIAGSDSGGGAGIQADLKTFAAHGVYGATVITALTAQNTCGVRASYALPPAIVAEQLAAVLEDIPLRAVKIGMLSSAEIIAVVAERLRAHQLGNIVLDTVLLATSGHPLLPAEALQALVEYLFPIATIVTPNLPEAARLLGEESVEDHPLEAAAELLAFGAGAVLLKGGHAQSDEIEDLLLMRGHPEPLRYRHARQRTPHTHGTGCALSSAIAAGLANNLPLPDAVGQAINWLQQAIAAAWPPGTGQGPVHHFWQMWPPGGRVKSED